MQHAISLKGRYITKMTDNEFLEFCQANNDFSIERLATKEIIITGCQTFLPSETIRFITDKLAEWNQKQLNGILYTNSPRFLLNNSAIRRPVLAWTQRARMSHEFNSGTTIVQSCPEFVVEEKKKGEDLKTAKSKMKEWIANGCKLGWLIDEKKQVLYIFERSKVRMHLSFAKAVSGEPFLPGFSVYLHHKSTEHLHHGQKSI